MRDRLTPEDFPEQAVDLVKLLEAFRERCAAEIPPGDDTLRIRTIDVRAWLAEPRHDETLDHGTCQDPDCPDADAHTPLLRGFIEHRIELLEARLARSQDLLGVAL